MHDESQKSITQIRDIIEDEKKRRTVPSKVNNYSMDIRTIRHLVSDSGCAWNISSPCMGTGIHNGICR